MPHPLAGRGRLASDKRGHRLGHMLFDKLRGLLLGRAPDFAHHQDGVGIGVGFKQCQQVDKTGTHQRIAAESHARTLAVAELRELPDGFVGERARATHHANVSGSVDIARHDANLAFARRDHAGTVGANQPAL